MEHTNEQSKKFIQKRNAYEIIKLHFALKKVMEEKNWGQEYIKLMYKVDPQKYECLYNLLDAELRRECEVEISKQIETGELDLYTYLVGKYKQQRAKEIRKTENCGEGR